MASAALIAAPLAALALLSAPVQANTSRADQQLTMMARRTRRRDEAPAWTAAQIKTPPERYQSAPPFIYRAVSKERLAEVCQNPEAVGCAIGGFVYGPSPCEPAFKGEALAKLLCHEGAHVAGWKSDHPE